MWNPLLTGLHFVDKAAERSGQSSECLVLPIHRCLNRASTLKCLPNQRVMTLFSDQPIERRRLPASGGDELLYSKTAGVTLSCSTSLSFRIHFIHLKHLYFRMLLFPQRVYYRDGADSGCRTIALSYRIHSGSMTT